MRLLSATTLSREAWTDEPGFVCEDDGLDPVANGELHQDAGDVRVDCRLADDQLGRDLAVCLAGREQAEPGAAIKAHHGDLNYLAPYGSIVFDVTADKGTTSAQTTLQPGNYLAVDLSSSNPDPPHATFVIAQAPQPRSLPRPGATITAIDFAFRGPSTLHDGELVRFQNNGFLIRPVQGIRVKNARNARRLTALLRAANDNEAPKLGISFPEFAGPLSPGGVQQETITERPGIYVLACRPANARTAANRRSSAWNERSGSPGSPRPGTAGDTRIGDPPGSP